MIQQLHISYEQKLLTSTDSIDPFLLENIIKKEIQNTQHATGKSIAFSSSCLSFVSIFVCVCSFLVILLWKRKKKNFLSFYHFFLRFLLSVANTFHFGTQWGWFQRRLLRGYGCLQCGRQQRKNRSFRVCRCKTCFSAGATRRKCRARHVNIFVFFFFVPNVPDRASMCGC